MDMEIDFTPPGPWSPVTVPVGVVSCGALLSVGAFALLGVAEDTADIRTRLGRISWKLFPLFYINAAVYSGGVLFLSIWGLKRLDYPGEGVHRLVLFLFALSLFTTLCGIISAVTLIFPKFLRCKQFWLAPQLAWVSVALIAWFGCIIALPILDPPTVFPTNCGPIDSCTHLNIVWGICFAIFFLLCAAMTFLVVSTMRTIRTVGAKEPTLSEYD